MDVLSGTYILPIVKMDIYQNTIKHNNNNNNFYFSIALPTASQSALHKKGKFIKNYN